MFLTDVKEIIEATKSPLKREAMATCEQQADDVFASAKIIHDGRLFDDLVSRNQEDVLLGVGFALKQFETGKQPWPSLTTIVYKAAEIFGIDFKSNEMRTMLMSATLGEMPNNAPFHGNPHYRKVLLSTIRQISVHNEIYRNTEWELGPRDIALMITAANIHDFRHDGKEKGESPMRLEKQSIALTAPFLVSAGADEDFQKDLETIVLSTYVRPFGSPEAPANQMKAAYQYYFSGVGVKPVLIDELKRLEDNPRLCLLAALFQEADLMPSLVYGYGQAKVENLAIAKEEGFVPSPVAQLGFMDSVSKGFITEAGKENNENLDAAYRSFVADRDAGIVDYTKGRLGNFWARNLPSKILKFG